MKGLEHSQDICAYPTYLPYLLYQLYPDRKSVV